MSDMVLNAAKIKADKKSLKDHFVDYMKEVIKFYGDIAEKSGYRY